MNSRMSLNFVFLFIMSIFNLACIMAQNPHLNVSGSDISINSKDKPYVIYTTYYDLQKSGQPLYLTSGAGGGLQFPVQPNMPYEISLVPGNTRLLECQFPLGTIVPCVPSNVQYASRCFVPSDPQTADVCQAYNGLYLGYWKDPSNQGNDLLNEQANLSYVVGNAAQNPALSKVFLDTIVNKSPTNFYIATTNAPLFIPGTAPGTADPSSLAGALGSGAVALHDTIYNVDHTKPGTLTIAGTNYAVNFFTSPDYTIQKGTPQTPAVRQHMAQQNLSLSLDPVNGNQTIILFPVDWEYNCQPAILIGKNKQDGTLFALTYHVNYMTEDTGTPCCWIQPQGQQGYACQNDTIHSSPWSALSTSAFVANFGQNKPLGGASSGTLNQGRMKVVIDPIGSCTYPLYWASTLQVLPGLYWPALNASPGSSDFTATPPTQC